MDCDIKDHNYWFINYFSQAVGHLYSWKKMRKSFVVPGIIFLGLGTLVFFISEKIRVEIEVVPISLMLVILFAAGLVMLTVGLASYVGNWFQQFVFHIHNDYTIL